MQSNAKRCLILGGSLSTMIGLLHIVMIFYGAPAYRYFGAGEEMATMAANGSIFPGLVTLFVAIIFILWGLYAFSGVKLIRRLPLLRVGLVIIGSIYTLRGLGVVVQIYWVVTSQEQSAQHDIVFSLVSLLVGTLYIVGTKLSWNYLVKAT